MFGRALIVSGCVALGGCVSVFEGTSQDIAINTNPPDATCVLDRPGLPIGGQVKTPGTVTVRKSKYDITIRCNKPGYQEATYINHSGVSAAIAANVVVDLVLTLGVSSIVDSSTGADNKYDSVVNIMLVPQTDQPTATSPTPGTGATPNPSASVPSATTVAHVPDTSEAAGLAGKWTASGHQPCEWSGTLTVRDRIVTGSISIDEVEMPVNTTLDNDGSLHQLLNPSQPAMAPTSRFAPGRSIEGHFPDLVVRRGQAERCHDVYMSFTKVNTQI